MTAGVRSVTWVFWSAIVDFGGNPSKWEDTWRTELDSAVEKNVDKTECCAQVRHEQIQAV